MRKYLVLLWLLLPLPFVVLHYGRGQQWLARDQANDLVRKAWSAEQKNDWKTADALYREAARLAAKDQPQLRLGLDLAQVRTRFRMGEAVTAIDMAERLVNDPAMAQAPQALQREARDLSARIHYYAAWVMRLEGANRELWMEEAELARQNFRLLAEQGPARSANRDSPPAEIRKARENLRVRRATPTPQPDRTHGTPAPRGRPLHDRPGTQRTNGQTPRPTRQRQPTRTRPRRIQGPLQRRRHATLRTWIGILKQPFQSII